MEICKKAVFFSVLLLVATIGVAGDRLTLGVEDGLDGEWDVRGYEGDTVRLYGSSGMTTFGFDTFRPEVQKKIVAWAVDDAFNSSSSLSIRVKQEEEREKKKRPPASEKKKEFEYGKIEHVHYTLLIKNRSAVAIDDIEVEYRIFYEESYGKSSILRVVDEKEVFSLSPGEKRTLTTDTVFIRDFLRVKNAVREGGDAFSRGSQTVVKDHLQGIHITLTRQDRNQTPVVRTCEKGTVPNKSEWDNYL